MELSNYLASKKLKTTPQRVDLFNLFKQNNNPMSFDFIQKQISNFDRSTLYRNLALFKKIDIRYTLDIDNTEHFALSSKFEHNILMICTVCKQSFVIDCQKEIDEFIHKLCSSSDFELHSHEIRLSGICSKCSAIK